MFPPREERRLRRCGDRKRFASVDMACLRSGENDEMRSMSLIPMNGTTCRRRRRREVSLEQRSAQLACTDAAQGRGE